VAREQFSSATKVEQQRLFTEEEATRLASIQTSDGRLVFNMDTPNLTYEIIGGFEKLRASEKDFETAILKIERDAATGRFDRIDDLDLRESIVFDQDWFEFEKVRHSDMINRLKTQISTKQGIFPCPQCKKSNTDTVELQTRASDEPMTIFNTCRDCGKAWKI
jgi:DNA-directed RNA polymerase subunit M/transcription elongation factor TFIIS